MHTEKLLKTKGNKTTNFDSRTAWFLVFVTTVTSGFLVDAHPTNSHTTTKITQQTDGDDNNSRSMIQSAEALAGRLLGERASSFVFEVIEPENGKDVFEIETREVRIVVRGNTVVSMSTGLNWYLKYCCKCNVSWCGNNINLPENLPRIETKIRKVTWTKYRYFLNYCCFGYSLPWWDWPQWERLIDWMALNGINAPLAVTGQEATWQAVCKKLGLTDKQITDFLAGPPYLPFGWMGCLDGWGGPLPQSWIDTHEALGKKILTRQRELGMTPILQGFTGHVPPAIKDKFPQAKLHTIHWIEWTTYLLDPLDPLFQRVADIFMGEQTKRFGTDHLYAADTFIEMKPPSGELNYLADMSKAIYKGMSKNDPEAVWVLQTWIFLNQQAFWTQDRIKAFLDAVDDEKMLCLDLACEDRPQWSRTNSFYGKLWTWCNVQNYGCTVFIGGDLDKNNTDLMEARLHPDNSKLVGLGFVNEGLGYNPVVYDFLFEMAWRNNKVELKQWIKDYAIYRYGQFNHYADCAWQNLLSTVYTKPNLYRTRSIIDCYPTLSYASGPRYSNNQLSKAWQDLLMASDKLGNVDTYRFDVVNTARQVLSNHASILQQKVVKAYQDKDYEKFCEARDDFLGLMYDLDELLATRNEFLLGKCLEDAKRWGTTVQEKEILEWDARRVLTLWGTTHINDYARKEWSGMISGYYYPRWKWFLDRVAESLEDGDDFDSEKFHKDLRIWMENWSDDKKSYPAAVKGDSIDIAQKLWLKYADSFKPDVFSLTTDKPVTCSSHLSKYPPALANDGFANNTDSYWATDVQKYPGNPWWQVDLQQPTKVGRVVLICYYGDKRYYGFTIETSLDGQTWEIVTDCSDNKELSTSNGYTCIFEPRKTRYIRITQNNNSANTGRHLVEVMAYKK